MGLAISDYRQTDSLRYQLRQRRFAYFMEIYERLPKPVRVLDVGGTLEFWRTMDMVGRDDLSLTILNVFEDKSLPNIQFLVGDARDLSQFEDKSFDIVFSNSVIEHVGTKEDQRQMANEIRRVAKNYTIQTPNRFFPIEPHVQFPFFQFMSRETRIWLHRNMSLATYPKAQDREQAVKWVDEIRLLSRQEIQEMFPEAKLIAETFFGFNKSYTAVFESK
jgi:ubiquinone/menaquinone biosynthesis C-methylase UbiE